jgi:hypothetical protein
MSLIVIEQGLITRVIDTTLVVATDATDTIGTVIDTVRENVLVSVRALVLVGGYLHESLHFPI